MLQITDKWCLNYFHVNCVNAHPVMKVMRRGWNPWRKQKEEIYCETKPSSNLKLTLTWICFLSPDGQEVSTTWGYDQVFVPITSLGQARTNMWESSSVALYWMAADQHLPLSDPFDHHKFVESELFLSLIYNNKPLVFLKKVIPNDIFVIWSSNPGITVISWSCLSGSLESFSVTPCLSFMLHRSGLLHLYRCHYHF